VVVSVIIISVSNNQTVELWSIQPSVLLNFLNSFSNIALGTTFSLGVANTWWTSATDGATFAQLHYIWDTGGGISLFYALPTGGNAKKVAITTLAIAVIKLATGPLLQRATHQAIQDIVTSDTIQLRITQRIPEGWMSKVLNFAAEGASAGSLKALATAQACPRSRHNL
jgi:hypothetical protein